MSLDNLKEYLKRKDISKKLKSYILEGKPYPNSDITTELIEVIVRETGVNSDYTARILKFLYHKDNLSFVRITKEIFAKKMEDTQSLINIMEDKLLIKISKIGELFYEHKGYEEGNLSNDFFDNFNRCIYENNKDDLIDILFLLTTSSDLSKIISFMSEIGYEYYKDSIKKYINEHVDLEFPLYELLRYIKEDDYKENFVLRFMGLWFDHKGYDIKFKASILSFIEEGEKDKNFKVAIKKIDNKQKVYDSYRFPEVFFPRDLKNMTEFENRIFKLSLDIDFYESMELIFNRFNRTYDYAKTYIEDNCLTYAQVIEFFIYASHFSNEEFKKFIDNNEKETLNALKGIPNLLQFYSLGKFFDIGYKELAYTFIWDIIPTAKSTILKVNIVNYLLKYKDNTSTSLSDIKKKIVKELYSKKVNVREIALNYIIKTYTKDDENLLKEFLDKEKSGKIKKIVVDFFVKKKISFSDGSEKSKKGEKSKELVLFSKEWFIYSAKKAKKKNLGWLDINSLPKLHYKDSGEAIGEPELFYFINIAATEKKIIPNEQLKKFGELIKKEDLTEFAIKMYEMWNREAKTKWALVYIAAFGDNSLIKPLRDEILKFVDYGRGAIAAQMVEAIAMIGTTDAFQTVDWFTKKVRHKQVKNAANEALVTAAKELNITKEELLDKIIPNFGFSELGIINLDFGARQFEIKLTPELSFLITDSNGKMFKNLPKVGKNDDAEKGNEASKFFKSLKKDVKTQVKLQKNRLENGFSANRLWSFKNWSELFIKNPMMKQFALTLVWGVYNEKGKLVNGFRFLEDGSFSDIEDEAFNIKNENLVGLVHPIELTTKQLEAWKELLDDYEITQSFEQLNRTIYQITDDNKDKLQIEDFMGFI